MRPNGLMNSECPPACAPAKEQKNSQVSNPNQKPGYVKGRQLAALIRIPTSYAFCLTKKSRKQRHQSRADQCHATTGHELLHALRLGTGVVVAVTLQQVDGSPDAETGTQCDNESLKNGYCAIEKCHKCVPPCTMRPCRRMNSDFPFACAPANGQTYSQVSNPN